MSPPAQPPRHGASIDVKWGFSVSREGFPDQFGVNRVVFDEEDGGRIRVHGDGGVIGQALSLIHNRFSVKEVHGSEILIVVAYPFSNIAACSFLIGCVAKSLSSGLWQTRRAGGADGF
jgi:hypothetical protein